MLLFKLESFQLTGYSWLIIMQKKKEKKKKKKKKKEALRVECILVAAKSICLLSHLSSLTFEISFWTLPKSLHHWPPHTKLLLKEQTPQNHQLFLILPILKANYNCVSIMYHLPIGTGSKTPILHFLLRYPFRNYILRPRAPRLSEEHRREVGEQH